MTFRDTSYYHRDFSSPSTDSSSDASSLYTPYQVEGILPVALSPSPSPSPSPTIAPSLLSSPSSSPVLSRASPSSVEDDGGEDADAEGVSDDGDDPSDETFDPEREKPVARKRVSSTGSSRRAAASTPPKSPSAKRTEQYKSKRSTRRDSISYKAPSKPKGRTRSSPSETKPNGFVIKPRYKYNGPRTKQVSKEEYLKWTESSRSVSGNCRWCSRKFTRSQDMERHMDTHTYDARGTVYVCCGVPISELPRLGHSPSDHQLYEFKGGLWAGGCFQILSRKDAMLRHWGCVMEADGSVIKVDSAKPTCIFETHKYELVELKDVPSWQSKHKKA